MHAEILQCLDRVSDAFGVPGDVEFLQFEHEATPALAEKFQPLGEKFRETRMCARNSPTNYHKHLHGPWKTKAEFQKDFNGPRLTSLRKWLAANVTLQTDFIIARSRAALPKILSAAPGSEKARIEANYHKVATTPQGTYALIDYVNFKGEGTKIEERYQGRGWGLLQVLEEMKPVKAGPGAAAEFSAAARRVLGRRIQLAPRPESQWRAGWFSRCDSYARPF